MEYIPRGIDGDIRAILSYNSHAHVWKAFSSYCTSATEQNPSAGNARTILIFRHPSYFGWFWFSIGTQILLGNPFCVVAYAIASWKFFKDRIPFEESALAHMYGKKYEAYREKTIVGIPFI